MRAILTCLLALLIVGELECADVRQKLIRKYRPIKGKRGTSVDYPRHYASPSALHLDYALGGGRASRQLDPAKGLQFGGFGQGAGQGGYSGFDYSSLNGADGGNAFAGFANLGQQGQQNSYAIQGLANLANSPLFSPASKTGPVTFGTHGGGQGSRQTPATSQSPLFTTASQSQSQPSQSSLQQPNYANIQLINQLQGSAQAIPLSAFLAQYRSQQQQQQQPIASALVGHQQSSGSSQPSYSQQSLQSAYSLGGGGGPTSYSSLAQLVQQQSAAGGGSHFQASPKDQTIYSQPAPAYTTYQPTADSSSLAAAAAAAGGAAAQYYQPQSQSTHAFARYTPSSSSSSAADQSSKYSSVNYQGAGLAYTRPSSSASSAYATSAGSSYSGQGTRQIANYAPLESSYAAGPSSSDYAAAAASFGSSGLQAAFSNLSPRYVTYRDEQLMQDASDSAKYDTISYSSPDGRYQ